IPIDPDVQRHISPPLSSRPEWGVPPKILGEEACPRQSPHLHLSEPGPRGTTVVASRDADHARTNGGTRDEVLQVGPDRATARPRRAGAPRGVVALVADAG